MKNLAHKDMLAYAQLAFPLAFAGLPLYIHAPDFYATHYGVSLAFLGIALLAIRLIDAVADPFLGRICDHYPRQRVIIMAAAAILFSLSFGTLYRPPPALEVFWFVTTVFLATLSFSVLFINLNAIGGLVARTEHEKTSISAWREGFGALGLTAAMLLPALLGDMEKYSLFCAGWMVASTILFILWYRKAGIAERTKPARISFSKMIYGPFRTFFAAYGVSMLASSFPAVLFLFFVREWLGAEDKAGIYLILYFLSAICGMPAWKSLSRRFPLRKLWIYSMYISAAGLSLAVLTEPQSHALYVAACVISGIGLGGELFLPPAILTNRISATGHDAQTSSYFGLYAFFMKSALAIATVVAFVILDAAGFSPAGEHACCGLTALVWLYALLPAAIKLAAIAILTSEANHEKTVNHSDIRSPYVV